MQALIEDYAMIGDCQTCALVARSGSIDFLSWPRFDGDACFAAMLGDEGNGRWLVAPDAIYPRVTRRYDGDTLALETDFEHESGAVRIVDFMPIRGEGSSVIRIVRGLSGTSRMRLILALRFDNGTMRPWVRLTDRGFVAELGPARVIFDCTVPLVLQQDTVYAVFDVAAGDQVAFSLSYSDAIAETPPIPVADAELDETKRFWLDWIGRFDKTCIRPDVVKRSLLTLKAMIHSRTGGLVAAASFGLPEKPHGDMNWDYRYTWLRDATFTLGALLTCGYRDEATAWGNWMQRAVGGDPTRLQIMYRLDGSRDLQERKAPQLAGHEGANPILIGNEAAGQLQLDVYGELLLAMHVSEMGGIERTVRGVEMERMLVEHLARTWNDPGADIWETRGGLRRYIYSQVMAWVGVDRFLRSERTRSTLDEATYKRLEICRDAIHHAVCSNGFSKSKRSFVQAYGSEAIDASLLLLPLVGFLPITDERVSGTIAAVEHHLLQDGFVRRMALDDDGDEQEGAFLACSCWLSDCYYLQGRQDEAVALLDRVIGVANDVGLLAEEYHVPTRRMIGNFPQALSHLAVVLSVMRQSGAALHTGI